MLRVEIRAALKVLCEVQLTKLQRRLYVDLEPVLLFLRLSSYYSPFNHLVGLAGSKWVFTFQ